MQPWMRHLSYNARNQGLLLQNMPWMRPGRLMPRSDTSILKGKIRSRQEILKYY